MNSVNDWTSVQGLRGVQSEQDLGGINLGEEQMEETESWLRHGCLT